MTVDKRTEQVEEVPEYLRGVVEAARRSPYECFASAAVALAFDDQRKAESTPQQEAKP